MTETRQIDSSLHATGTSDLGDLDQWVDPDTQTTYSTTLIPACLMDSLNSAFDDHSEQRSSSETIKVWLGRVVTELLEDTLANNSCANGEADDFDDPDDWDVLVVRSQPDDELWGEVVGTWYAHPLFQGEVVAKRETGGGLAVLSVTSHEVV